MELKLNNTMEELANSSKNIKNYNTDEKKACETIPGAFLAFLHAILTQLKD